MYCFSYAFIRYFTNVCHITFTHSSSVRPFRHTATLAGLQIVNALITAATELRKDADTLEQQLQSEKKKKGTGVAALTDRLKKSRTQLSTLDKFVHDLYNGVFVHRYRDTVPEVNPRARIRSNTLPYHQLI